MVRCATQTIVKIPFYRISSLRTGKPVSGDLCNFVNSLLSPHKLFAY